MKANVYISTSQFAKEDDALLDFLQSNAITYQLNPRGRKLTEEELIADLKEGKYAGLLAGTEPITSRLFDEIKDLKVVSRVGVGLDSVDLRSAEEKDIRVLNTPDVLTEAVSELTMGLMLDALRKISLQDKALKAGVWKKQMGSLLQGKTVGIVGYGKIGQKVAQLVSAFGANVIFSDPFLSGEGVELDQLFQEADILTFHANAKETLLTSGAIKKLKEGVIVINTARGELIEEVALIEALRSGHVGFAALDVFENEPYEGELKELENVVLTPHIGSYAKEARMKMERMAVDNLIEAFKDLRLL